MARGVRWWGSVGDGSKICFLQRFSNSVRKVAVVATAAIFFFTMSTETDSSVTLANVSDCLLPVGPGLPSVVVDIEAARSHDPLLAY